MTTHDKLVHRFLSKPKDFTWKELVTMFSGFGYTRLKAGKASGSRVRFAHEIYPPIMLHRPHPGRTLKRYQIEQIEEMLKKEGLL